MEALDTTEPIALLVRRFARYFDRNLSLFEFADVAAYVLTFAFHFFVLFLVQSAASPSRTNGSKYRAKSERWASQTMPKSCSVTLCLSTCQP